jgi:hypothetical protein
MAVNIVQRVQKAESTTSVGPQETKRTRLDIDQLVSSFENDSSTDLSGVASFLNDPDSRTELESYLAAMPEDERAKFTAAAGNFGINLMNGTLAPNDAAAVVASAGGVRGVSASALTTTTPEQTTEYIVGAGAQSRTDQSQYFILTALGGMENYLHGFATGVQNSTQIGVDLRESYTELADMLQDWGDDEQKKVSWNEVTYDKDGNPTVTPHSETLTKAKAQELLASLDDMKQSTSDMTQLKQQDLQNKYQDYTAAIQTITNILKDYNDDASKMIANFKA